MSVSVVQVNFHSPDIRMKNHERLAEHGPAPDVTYAILYIDDPDQGRNGEGTAWGKEKSGFGCDSREMVLIIYLLVKPASNVCDNEKIQCTFH